MDGLIPLAFKAMKKNRTRRRYECLSSSGGTIKAESYDDYNFFPFAAKSNHSVASRPSSSFDHMEMNTVGAQQRLRHRRGWSVGDFSSMSCREGRRSGADEIGYSPSRRGQLLRNRSHRLFSCVSGE